MKFKQEYWYIVALVALLLVIHPFKAEITPSGYGTPYITDSGSCSLIDSAHIQCIRKIDSCTPIVLGGGPFISQGCYIDLGSFVIPIADKDIANVNIDVSKVLTTAVASGSCGFGYEASTYNARQFSHSFATYGEIAAYEQKVRDLGASMYIEGFYVNSGTCTIIFSGFAINPTTIITSLPSITTTTAESTQEIIVPIINIPLPTLPTTTTLIIPHQQPQDNSIWIILGLGAVAGLIGWKSGLFKNIKR